VATASGEKIAPATLDALSASLRESSGGGLAVTSGGTSSSDRILVSVERLRDVSLDAPAGTLTAGGGARITDVVEAASKAGLKVLGLDEQARSQYVGSLIARGEVSRRGVCGIVAVLSDGDVVRWGGNVQKDVAGYDIAAMLLGSLGRLAVIATVTFRVIPAAADIVIENSAGETAIIPVPGLRRAFDPSGALSRD
jgi:FAD/FMN-containing dehydrogenase